MKERSDRFDTFLTVLGLLLLISALVSSYILFYSKKDFDFIVEAPCDPTVQSCFIRDCEADECPPNMLSEYRVFHMRASDFGSCTDNTCLSFCEANTLTCLETICGDDPADMCSLKQ